MPAAGFGCIHSRTTGSVEETFFLRYHDGAVAGGEATFRPCRYDGCVLSRWSASGSDDPLEPWRLARLLAQRHLLFSERASDGSTSVLGEACALFRFNGVERYGSKYGTTPDVMYTSTLPFPVGSHRNGVACKVTRRISSKVFQPDVQRRCALHS